MIRRKPLARVPFRRKTTHDLLWEKSRRTVLLRAKGRCEVCGRPAPLDVHHIVKRSQGGSHDPDWNLIALCRPCHDRTDAPYSKGRLVITPIGMGFYRHEVFVARDKYDALGRAECSKNRSIDSSDAPDSSSA